MIILTKFDNKKKHLQCQCRFVWGHASYGIASGGAAVVLILMTCPSPYYNYRFGLFKKFNLAWKLTLLKMHRQNCHRILFCLKFPSSLLWIRSQNGVSLRHFPGSLTLNCIGIHHRNRILNRTSRYCWRSWSVAPGQQILKWSNSFENI